VTAKVLLAVDPMAAARLWQVSIDTPASDRL